MLIAIASPTRPGSTSGNDVTAARWASRLHELGHETTLVQIDESHPEIDESTSSRLEPAELLIVIHARRCASAATWWRERRGSAPLVVALAGTDLYVDMPADAATMATVAAADHLVVLQPRAVLRLDSLMAGASERTTVVHQSVGHPLPARAPLIGEFRVVVLAHLREVKDPLMCARAARLLPETSRVAVHHGGAAYDERWERDALAEVSANPRYRWYRELTPSAALKLMATADVVACTSIHEGGANVVTEAIAMGVPIIGTRIDGNVGLVGEDYPALVPVGDIAAMADLLTTLETTASAMDEIDKHIAKLKPITEVAAERAAWAGVLAAVT